MHQITTKSISAQYRTEKKSYNPLGTVAFLFRIFLPQFTSKAYWKRITSAIKGVRGMNKKNIKCLQFNGKSICINMTMGHIRTTNVYNICYENSFVGSDDSCILASFILIYSLYTSIWWTNESAIHTCYHCVEHIPNVLLLIIIGFPIQPWYVHIVCFHF